MSWDGNGTFTRTKDWTDDRDATTKILASRHDENDDELEQGIQACVTRSGETPPTADFKPNADDTYALGASALRWKGLYLSGPVNENQGSDIASASTINLDTATGNLVDVTGTTTITAITLAQGRERVVRFTGALAITHGSALVMPNATSAVTRAGDFAVFRGYAAGVVRCVYITPGAVQEAGVAKAWVMIEWQTGTPTILASHNVTSLSDGGTGIVTVNFTIPFSTGHYAVCGAANASGAQSEAKVNMSANTLPAANSCQIVVTDSAGNAIDARRASVVFFGTQ